MMVDTENEFLSIRQQCTLLDICRSSLYYQAIAPSDESLLANEIHDLWLTMPFYGYRRVTAHLQRQGYDVNRKKVLRIMREMRIQAIYPKPKTTIGNVSHKIYPYLLRDIAIDQPNHVWSTDITYIKMQNGFMYLVALLDIYSRFVLSWRLSNTLDSQFCLDMLYDALDYGKPKPFIINTDQGCQFTSFAWINAVEGNGIKVSMDGRGRWVDNVFIERFWRTIKHEHLLLHRYETVTELKESIGCFIKLYNYQRLHQNLDYKTPADVYFGNPMLTIAASGGLHPTLLREVHGSC